MTNPDSSVLEALSADERLALIERLWDSLTDEEIPLTEAQRAELERRLARFEEDKAGAVSWDALRAELRIR